MRKFQATEQQIRQVMANAFNASSAMGMGFLHFTPENKTADDFRFTEGKTVHMDYVDGRMVKLAIYPVKDEPGFYTISDGEPRRDYQSWEIEYPTYDALLMSAGISIEIPL